MKKILGCLLLGILVLLSTERVFAAEQPDFDREGSINIYMRATTGNLVTGGSVEVYKVADVYKSSKGYKYIYTSEFVGSGYSLDEEVADLAEELHNYAVDNDIYGDIYNDTAGTINVNNLTAGLYLVDNKKAPEGYKKIIPFLVSVPLQVEGTWIYEVDASPKMSLLSQETLEPGPMPKPEDKPVIGLPEDDELEDNLKDELDDESHSDIISNIFNHIKSPATGDESVGNGSIMVIMICLFLACIAGAFTGVLLLWKRKIES